MDTLWVAPQRQGLNSISLIQSHKTFRALAYPRCHLGGALYDSFTCPQSFMACVQARQILGLRPVKLEIKTLLELMDSAVAALRGSLLRALFFMPVFPVGTQLGLKSWF